MRPTFAGDNLIHGHIDDTVHSGKFANAYAEFGILAAKFNNLRLIKQGMSVLFALYIVAGGRAAAALLDHVVYVVMRRAGKEVSRIIARWPVAFMQNIQAVRDRAIGQFIGDAVRSGGAAIYVKLTIPMLIAGTLPVPAFVRAALVYLFPKAISKRSNDSEVECMTEDKARGLTADMSEFGISSFGDGGWFTTAAHAQAAGIWVNFWCRPGLCVAVDISKWFALDPSCFFAILWRNFGLAATAAMTVTVRDFVRGIIHSVIRSFQRMAVLRDCFSNRRSFLRGFSKVSIAHLVDSA